MRTVLRVVAALVGSLLVIGGLAAAAAATADEDDPGGVPVTTARAELSAPVDVASNAVWVRLLTVSFEAAAGQARSVDATVVAAVAPEMVDTVLVLHAELRCGPESGAPSRSMVQFVNIWRGTSRALTPTVTYRAPSAGQQTCALWVRSGRPRPVAGALDNRLGVLAGSFLLVDHVHSDVAEDFRPAARSFLVDRARTPLGVGSSLTWRGGRTSAVPPRVAVRGWISLTSCTSLSGSTDPVTGVGLCTRRHRDPRGGTVFLRTHIDQVDDDGRLCRRTWIGGAVGRPVAVPRLVHHLSRSYRADVGLVRRCAPTLRLRTTVRWRSGSSMMVHRQGTLLTVTPLAD